MTHLSFADLIAMREELKRILAMNKVSEVIYYGGAEWEALHARLGVVEAEIKRRLI